MGVGGAAQYQRSLKKPSYLLKYINLLIRRVYVRVRVCLCSCLDMTK